MLLDNRMLDAVVGYHVITPLLLGDGLPAVLIDRGWKARAADQRFDMATPPAGPVTVEGLAVARPSALLKLGSTPKLDVPGVWQNLDYEAYEKVTQALCCEIRCSPSGCWYNRCLAARMASTHQRC